MFNSDREKKREISLKRARELKKTIEDYRKAVGSIPTGFKRWPQIQKNQERIKAYFGAGDEEWSNWHWHLRNRITSTEVLKDLLPLTEQELEEIELTGSRYRWAVSPYYLSLIDPEDPDDPIKNRLSLHP